METVAFVDVNIIPMESDRVCEHQTVIISGDRISEMGAVDEVAVPVNAELIQANGAYLVPGLADMHSHPSEFDPDPRHLILYIANGVTTLRSLNTPWEFMDWREKVNTGELLGPTIYLSGPAIVGVPPDSKILALGLRTGIWLIFFLVSIIIFGLTWVILNQFAGPGVENNFIDQWFFPWLIGSAVLGILLIWRKFLPIAPLAAFVLPQATIVETASQARSAVNKQVKAGVDFIKPYDFLNRESYFAAIKAAQENRI